MLKSPRELHHPIVSIPPSARSLLSHPTKGDNRVTGMRVSPDMVRNAYPDGFTKFFAKIYAEEPARTPSPDCHNTPLSQIPPQSSDERRQPCDGYASLARHGEKRIPGWVLLNFFPKNLCGRSSKNPISIHKEPVSITRIELSLIIHPFDNHIIILLVLIIISKTVNPLTLNGEEGILCFNG